MRNPIRFFIELMQQQLWIPVWVLFLVVINVASVAFWSEPLAKAVFVTFIFSAMLILALYSRFGFEKIMGMGHVPWIPLLAYVLMEIPAAKDPFRGYLIILSISIAISLVFDIVDVWKYFTTRKRQLTRTPALRDQSRF
jgi:hypothetical protein